MGCSEFLESYSDYRDGLITDPHTLRRLRAHVARCRACRRLDASLREGVRALRDDPQLDPSPDFAARLKARLARATAEPLEPVTPGAAGIAAALMVVAAVALLIYEGSRRQSPPAPPPVVVAADRPLPMVVVNPGVPFVTFTDLSVSPFQAKPGAGTLRVDSDIPLGTWANLPR